MSIPQPTDKTPTCDNVSARMLTIGTPEAHESFLSQIARLLRRLDRSQLFDTL